MVPYFGGSWDPLGKEQLLVVGEFQVWEIFIVEQVACLAGLAGLVGWLVGRSAGWSVGRSAAWLVGWSVGRSVGWPHPQRHQPRSELELLGAC